MPGQPRKHDPGKRLTADRSAARREPGTVCGRVVERARGWSADVVASYDHQKGTGGGVVAGPGCGARCECSRARKEEMVSWSLV